jgi:hypothetical protein
MNEIDIVVDVRQSPDTAELIVSKQKLAFSGEASLVGSPVESRVGLMTRKAKVDVFAFAEAGYGFVVAARVKNVGTVPFDVTRVVFEHEYTQPQERRIGGVVAHEMGGTFDLLPRHRDRKGALQPGEEREYYLPQELYDAIGLLALSLPGDRFWFAAYSGTERVGQLAGEYIQPFFDRIHIGFHRRALPIFHTLPESDRIAVIKAVAPLRALEPSRWPSAGAEPLGSEFIAFVVRATDDLAVVVTQTEERKVEVVDIVRESALDQADTPGEGTKQ